MDRKLSDQQVDKIAETLLKDFALSDAELDEIAGSPKIWWNVRKGIEAEKARREKKWFAAFRSPALAFGALACIAFFGLAILVLNFRSDSTVAEKNPVQNPVEEIAQNPEVPKKTNPAPERVPVKNIEPKTGFVARNQRRAPSSKRINKPSKTSPGAAVEETKTDFIALSYANAADGGQILRVKVPGAMLVSLGLKANVEDESALVQAEVVIGDDGLARAIRFIR